MTVISTPQRPDVTLGSTFDPFDAGAVARHMLSYQLTFRLLGDRSDSSSIATAAANVSSGEPEDVGLCHSLAYALDAALALQQTPEAIGHAGSHWAHRMRLGRDLRRHSSADRLILALRHLADLPPARVAAITGRNEDDIREVSGQWVPADRHSFVSTGETVVTLRHAGWAERNALAHLDDSLLNLPPVRLNSQ